MEKGNKFIWIILGVIIIVVIAIVIVMQGNKKEETNTIQNTTNKGTSTNNVSGIATPENTVKKEPETTNKTGNIYSVSNKTTVNNNIFKYENVYFSEYKMESVVLYMDFMQNISQEEHNAELKIKLYDANKNCIGEYDNDMGMSIKPNEQMNLSFTIYDDGMNGGVNNGYTLQDVKYFSIENL